MSINNIQIKTEDFSYEQLAKATDRARETHRVNNITATSSQNYLNTDLESTHIWLKREPQEPDVDAYQAANAISTEPDEDNDTEDVFQIAAKAEQLLRELLDPPKPSPPKAPPQHININPINTSPPPYYPPHGYQMPPHPPVPVPVPPPHANPAFYINTPPPNIRPPAPVPLSAMNYQYPVPYPTVAYPPHGYTHPYHHHQMQHQQQPYPPQHHHPASYYQPAPVPQYRPTHTAPYNPYKRKFDQFSARYPPKSSGDGSTLASGGNTEDDDLNIMRERELMELKCKSVVEKMSVFVAYYQQFKEAYQQRIKTAIECASDALKMQFHALVKYLNEYETLLCDLDLMINEHERDRCKNNHRKTKKFFNKIKAFIRYDCQKRLQSNIFEYRRQINSPDRFAGMYDLLDMNNFLIGLLPDIGVSIRRFINKCEKAREMEQIDDEAADYLFWNNESDDDNEEEVAAAAATAAVADGEDNDEDFDLNEKTTEAPDGDSSEKSASFNEKENNEATSSQQVVNIYQNKPPRSFESFSKGVDSLNRYLLKRVEDEESLDELVKERIIKWINKRQAKYILIFSEVDKLLNQHKDGECYQKFHSFLLFNLGKLVTVCDSYHQKLKELLYSTTIRRKKKRKKVKLLPESMSDVFDEINELKRALEHTKSIIKKCNEFKNF